MNEQLTLTCKVHYWLINSDNIGHCKNCNANYDFREANRKLDPVYSRRVYVDHLGGADYYMQGSILADSPMVSRFII